MHNMHTTVHLFTYCDVITAFSSMFDCAVNNDMKPILWEELKNKNVYIFQRLCSYDLVALYKLDYYYYYYFGTWARTAFFTTDQRYHAFVLVSRSRKIEI